MSNDAATLAARYRPAMRSKIGWQPRLHDAPCIGGARNKACDHPDEKRHAAVQKRHAAPKNARHRSSACAYLYHYWLWRETAMPAKDVRRYIIMSNEGFLSDLLTATELVPSAKTVNVMARAAA